MDILERIFEFEDFKKTYETELTFPKFVYWFHYYQSGVAGNCQQDINKLISYVKSHFNLFYHATQKFNLEVVGDVSLYNLEVINAICYNDVELFKWAEEHLEGRWSYIFVETYKVCFLFEKPTDRAQFSLTWL